MQYYDFLKELPNNYIVQNGKLVSFVLNSETALDMFNNTKPFVFKDLDTSMTPVFGFTTFNLPFKHCWFESIGKPLLMAEIRKNQKVELNGIYVGEDEHIIIYTMGKLLSVHNFPDDQILLVKAIVSTIADKINTQFKGSYNPRQFVKSKIGGVKHSRRINEVIYISPTKNIKSDCIDSRDIDWSYRFDVRGHWAHYNNKNTIGHDQNGNIIYGKTWRKSYVKGAESLPYIKKVRVLK